jgi:hypothetical protein
VIQGIGYRVSCVSCRVQGSWFGFKVEILGSGFRIPSLRFTVQDLGFRAQGLRFRVQGSGFRVQGSGLRVHRVVC